MPRQIDLSRSKATVKNSPTNTIGQQQIQAILQNGIDGIPALTLQFIEEGINNLLAMIDQVTGLDLLAFAHLIEDLLGVTTNLLTTLLDNIPLIGPIIQAITGTTVSGSEGAALSYFIQFIKDILEIIGGPTGLGTGNPIVGLLASNPMLIPLFEAIITALGGAGSALSTMESLLGGVASAVTDVADLISGVGGTVISDVTNLINKIQQLIDDLYNLVTGGSSTGNPLSSLVSTLQNGLAGLLPAVNNNGNGTWTALSGVTNTGNGTFSYTPSSNPIQSLVNNVDGTWSTVAGALQNAVTGAESVGSNLINSVAGVWGHLFGAVTGAPVPAAATPAQAFTALSGQAASTATNTQNIGGMTGLTVANLNQALQQSAVGTGGGSGGTNATVNFASLANAADLTGAGFTQSASGLASIYGTRVTGIGINSGAASWLYTTGTASDLELYSTQTTTDYQVVSLNIGAVRNLFPGGQPMLGLVGRSNAAGDTCVLFDFQSEELFAVVSGVRTPLAGVGITINHGDLWELVLGNSATSNLYQIQVIQNGTVVLTYSDVGHVTQVGSSYRYGGVLEVGVKSGATYYYPADVTAWGVADNAPPSVIGSMFRAYKTTANSAVTANVGVTGGIFDTVEWNTGDFSYNSSTGVLTANNSGTYLFSGRTLSTGATTMGVLKNGSAFALGIYDGTAVATHLSTPVYCSAGDTIQPYFLSSTNIGCGGVTDGSTSYWSFSLMNRGTLS